VVRALIKVLENFGEFYQQYCDNRSFFHFCARFVLNEWEQYIKFPLLGQKASDRASRVFFSQVISRVSRYFLPSLQSTSSNNPLAFILVCFITQLRSTKQGHRRETEKQGHRKEARSQERNRLKSKVTGQETRS